METVRNNLIYLRTEKILPHPKNPRKELGDLTEMAESIKANGIMQNLTVVEVGNLPAERIAELGVTAEQIDGGYYIDRWFNEKKRWGFHTLMKEVTT